MRNIILPNLSALRAFEAAARLESFTKAALELGVTQAAVSKQIRRLEEDLGQALFKRSHRAVSLTDSGERYAERVSQAFQLLADHEVQQEPKRGRVVLDIDEDLMSTWLMPRLTERVLAELDLDLDVRVRLDQPKIFPPDTEIAVTWGSAAHEGFRSRVFLRPRVLALSAPVLSDGRQAPMEVSEIENHRFLNVHNDAWWREYFEASGRPYPSDTDSLSFNRSYLMVEAAQAGLGLAMGDDALAETDLKSGTLLALRGPILKSRDFFLHLRKPRLSFEGKRVAEWLQTEAVDFAEWQDRGDFLPESLSS